MTESLTLKQAYLAMYAFLDAFYDRTKSDDVGWLLGDMSFLMDRRTADSAAWSDWLDAVKKITEENDENYGFLRLLPK